MKRCVEKGAKFGGIIIVEATCWMKNKRERPAAIVSRAQLCASKSNERPAHLGDAHCNRQSHEVVVGRRIFSK